MAKFTVSATECSAAFGPSLGPKIYAALKQSIENFDLNDGWETAATSKAHKLGVVPKFVQVQVSDNADGSNYDVINATAINSTSITLSTAKAFMRVLANR